MQIPILNGIYTDSDSEFRTSYPTNLVPVPKKQGISNGYLRPGDGIAEEGTGPGVGRGGVNWNDVCYRVMGEKLVSISDIGTVTELGDVPGSDVVTLDYSFDYLGVVANERFFLWAGPGSFQEVTDPDLGAVIDFIWVDGYFMLTDGEFLIVTELTDPTSIDPLKYGSSEVDPDPIKALIKVRNEPHALNRYTIEIFDNVGGTGFPFQRVDGAQVMRGTVGTHTCCLFLENIAFMGGGRGESIAVWVASSGSSAKISTREIDTILAGYSEGTLSTAVLEPRVDKNHQHLYLHLPDQTLVYDASAAQEVGEQVWFRLVSSLTDAGRYRARDFVWCYSRWLCTDPTSTKYGNLTLKETNHWGDRVAWSFDTTILYNDGAGALFHRVELVSLTGRNALGNETTISTQYTLDGETYSVPRFITIGKQGQRDKRLVWLQQGNMRHWRSQRFTGTSDARISPARLEIQIEPLAV